jgi:hypothetical protein
LPAADKTPRQPSRWLATRREMASRRPAARPVRPSLPQGNSTGIALRKSYAEHSARSWRLGSPRGRCPAHDSNDNSGSAALNHLHRVGHRCCPRTWQLGPTERHSLFHSKRDRLIKDPRKWFATALEPARIDGVTWQTLRHTFASRFRYKVATNWLPTPKGREELQN